MKTVRKYTKMPEHDVESSLSWQNNTHPKLRRVTDLPQEHLHTTDSYYKKTTPYCSSSKRKIITIEDDKSIKSIFNSANTSIANNNKKTTPKDNNVQSQRNSCRFLRTGSKEANTGAGTAAVKQDFKKSTIKINNISKNKVSNPQSKLKQLNTREEDTSNYKQHSIHDIKKMENNIPKSSRRILNIEKDKPLFHKGTPKTITSNLKRIDSLNSRHSANLATEITEKEVNKKLEIKNGNNKKTSTIDKACETDIKVKTKNVSVNVIPETKSTNTETITDEYINNIITSHYDKKDECQINSHNGISQFDSLCIPNISLKKDKSIELTEDKSSDLLNNYSLPNLEIPSLTIVKHNDSEKNNNSCNNESSYIISQATVTYTTEQKFDLKVVGGKEIDISNVTPAPKYPLNVVSFLKKEIKCKKKGLSKTLRNIPNNLQTKTVGNMNDCGLSVRRSWRDFNRSQLMKPSDVISTMTHNNLFANSFISEQFQKELEFIDSFIESLQYLENYSLTKKAFSSQVQRSFDGLYENKRFHVNKTKYNVFLPQHDSDLPVNIHYQTNTKNLCLLNMLIRDEQKRAKNLLFVLKMREDALKNFTKSQILWLENKKKHENTDSTTLKKKQRGALLRLQHECGEMDRIRKSLLSLSEKRKAILMKTKKNIELKLAKGDDQVSTSNSKKKVRKSSTESFLSPIKCYNLSESSNNESTVSKDYSKEYIDEDNCNEELVVTSVEKSIQTSDSIFGTLNDQNTNAPAESFVVVDGSYLNILFQNLTLPKMFYEGKQYEVNEEALSNILTSSNILKDTVSDTETIRNFIEQMENCDSESTASTARSLVDEFDQYYKDLESYEQHSSSVNNSSGSDEISPDGLIESNENQMLINTVNVKNNQGNMLQMEEAKIPSVEKNNDMNNIDLISKEKCICDSLKRESNFEEIDIMNMNVSSTELPILYELTSMPATRNWQTSGHESPNTSSLTLDEPIVIDSEVCSEIMTVGVLPPPAVSEAEELRRQQLAIELEIKAIEQQQSLVVREIPDKPPPPYMPPADKRKISSIRRFTAEHCLESKVKECLQKNNPDTDDPFEELIKDFCIEKNEKIQSEVSDKPWNAYNLVPSVLDKYKGNIHKQISIELREVLTDVSSNSALLALGNRRSDHTDEILFSEWRRCEKEWTSLHIDESHVKNQLFESIFEKILTDSIDEYKKTVIEGNIRTD